MSNFILATAGHIDHGKSALVKALTGTDPDRLPEEKARGITIDLGFAELNLKGPKGEQFHVGIVDVPGHEDFVRNMIAGVGSIDLALLAVAADDGWMPQTEEHLQILTYLDVKRIVVALTKADLGKIDHVAARIREKLHGTPFTNCAIVPTSTRTGDGIENLKSALASELATLSAPRDIGKPRLFADRAFSLHGIGTVVTGTLTDGTLPGGDTIFVQPRGTSARIRSLQTHGRDVDRAQPGTRTAMNLPELQVRTEVNRGDVITHQPFEASSTLEVVLSRSARLQRALPMKSGSSAYVHHGTMRVLAKIILNESRALAAGQAAPAQLRLETPLVAFVGDRLIIRDASEQQTLAGGVIVSLDPQTSRSKQQRSLLASRAVAPGDVALAVWTEVSVAGIIEPARLLDRSRFSAAEIAAALQRLGDHGEVFLHGNVAAKTLVWREFLKRAAEFIDNGHQARPDLRGVELNDLRAELNSISSDVFDALISDLCARGFVRAGSTIARGSHRANLPPKLQTAADRIRAALAEKPFDPPNRKDLLLATASPSAGGQDRDQQQALKFLLEQGEISEVSDEIVLLRESLDQMRTIVSDFISKNGPATASQLREKIGTSRRVIIPVLEYFDRQGVTQRTGDLRQLREAKSAAVAQQ